MRREIVNDLSQLMSPFHKPDSAQPSNASAVPPNPVVHPLVACDVCDRPIVGVRYKCGCDKLLTYYLVFCGLM